MPSLTAQSYNQLNHPIGPPGAAYTAAANGTSVAGTVVPVNAGSGAGSATSLAAGQVATDAAGSFTITAAGAPAAGVVATLNLLNPFPAQELPVYWCSITDNTGAPNLAVAASATPVVAAGQVTGISICSALLIAAHTYAVSYACLGAPGSS
jgi:hypothetical protein